MRARNRGREFVLFVVWISAACGGGGGSTPAPSPNPAPAISSLSPTSATAGGAAFTLTVNGSGFVSASVVRWNGSSRATTFVSSTQLTASIPASDIVTGGAATVTVFNPAPGGGSSGGQSFPVNSPCPTLSALAPLSAVAAAAGLTLTVTGTNFVPGSVVRWNGSDRATTFGSSTQLTATIPASDLRAGTATVTVVTPSPGGGTSGGLPFAIVVTLERVSVATDGSQGDLFSISGFPAISADGRFVAFQSSATNLVVSDTNNSFDVFVRDTCLGATGCTPTTARVSVASDGAQGNSFSSQAAMSADGRFVAFVSAATNVAYRPIHCRGGQR